MSLNVYILFCLLVLKYTFNTMSMDDFVNGKNRYEYLPPKTVDTSIQVIRTNPLQYDQKAVVIALPSEPVLPILILYMLPQSSLIDLSQ